MRATLALAFWLVGACWAEPAVAGSPPSVPAAAQTTTRQVQGGLVDVRYGQVAIDLGGEAQVLELVPHSELYLDAKPVTSDDLLKAITSGLSAVATYRSDSGAVQRLEAYTAGAGQPKVHLTLLPTMAPAYPQGQLLTVMLPATEKERLGTKTLRLHAPGLGQARFVPADRGGLKAHLRMTSTSNLVNLPLFVESDDEVFRGPSVSLAHVPPVLRSFGPHTASSKLASVPGWVDLSHPPGLLDLSSARLRVAPGLLIKSFRPRVDRTVFELEAEAPGWYWIEFEIQDQLGQTSRQRWDLQVLP